MAYRNKLYVAFDGDNDMQSYKNLKLWDGNRNMEFSFHDAHDINTANDTSLPDSIKDQLRERMQNSKVMLLLVGSNTRFLRLFVPFEIRLARRLDVPIVVVNLNKNRRFDEQLCPSTVRDDSVSTIHIAYEYKIIKYAIDNFPESYKGNKGRGHLHYPDDVYRRIGL